jgi:hypothetical protein
MLVSGSDTLYQTVMNSMVFFENIRQGKATVTITHISFETAVAEVEIGRKTEKRIQLKPKEYRLDGVTVNGRIPLITTSGDTIRFNAAAVKLLEGDEAIEILKQIPGVEVSESGITVLGESIRKTYINKHLIFGRNEMNALLNLPAAEVISINTYREYMNPDSLARRGSNEMVRVLDIRTRNPIFSATTAHVLASLGHDFDSYGQTRWGGGATANFFSESLLLSANLFSNNVGRTSNRLTDILQIKSPKNSYNERNHANVDAEKLWGKDLEIDYKRLSGGYTYDRNYDLVEMMQNSIYFPTEEYSSREYSDSTKNRTTVQSHAGFLNFDVVNPDIGNFSVSVALRLSDDRANYRRVTESVRDNDSVEGLNIITQKNSGYVANGKLSFRSSSRRSFGYGVNAEYIHSDSDGSGYRIDSATSTPLKTTIETGPFGVGRKTLLGGKLNYTIEKERISIIALAYAFNHDKTTRKRFAADITDAANLMEDQVNTYDYSTDYNTHDVRLSYSNLHTQGSSTLVAAIGYKRSDAGRDEHYPGDRNFNRTQAAILPSLSYRISWRGFNLFQMTYETSVQLPSIEQWRDGLDNRNPYQLVAGNPGLKQSYKHSLSADLVLSGIKGASTTFNVELMAIQNDITSKTTFFARETPLPQWNTVAAAQSVLTEYVNLNGYVNGSIRAYYRNSSKVIKCSYGFGTSLSYSQHPSYVEKQLNDTRVYTPGVNAYLRSNFSRNFRMNLSLRGNYIYSRNTAAMNYKMVNVGGEATTVWDITKWLYVNIAYNLSYYNTHTHSVPDNTFHILNTMIGSKLFKGNVYLNLTTYDILNKNAGFQTSLESDYIRTIRTLSFGRYYMLNIGIKIFKSKSGLTQPANIQLRDGS